MAALNKLQIAQLRDLQQSPAWEVMVQQLMVRIAQINARTCETVADSAFEELRTLHKGQGGVEELKKLFEDLERGAFE